jgi:hypothetical protein
MLSLRDCLDWADLAPEVVEAIADHERVPAIVAVQLAACLAASPAGVAVLRGFIHTAIAEAVSHGDMGRAEGLRVALGRYGGG